MSWVADDLARTTTGAGSPSEPAGHAAARIRLAIAWCELTKAQAALNEQAVQARATKIREVDGIERRGVVLPFLMRFEQICNPLSHWLGDHPDFIWILRLLAARLPAVKQHLAAHGRWTNTDHREQFGVSRREALRELQELARLGFLLQRGRAAGGALHRRPAAGTDMTAIRAVMSGQTALGQRVLVPGIAATYDCAAGGRQSRGRVMAGGGAVPVP